MYSDSRMPDRTQPAQRDQSRNRKPVDHPAVLRISPPVASWKDGWHLPVMPMTLLLAELALQQNPVDLELLSQIILGDLGATLQVLRCVDSEYPDAEEGPFRMAECIVVLGLQACMDALREGRRLWEFKEDRRRRMVELWNRSRTVAEQARSLADRGEQIDPEQAYLVGLCSEIGNLPEVLGWPGGRHSNSNHASTGAELAKAWALPGCVLKYFSQPQSLVEFGSWPYTICSTLGALQDEDAASRGGTKQHLRLLRAV
ncbi:MAG: HDOD domain-containing protein [Acidobacteriaceae bacterium]